MEKANADLDKGVKGLTEQVKKSDERVMKLEKVNADLLPRLKVLDDEISKLRAGLMQGDERLKKFEEKLAQDEADRNKRLSDLEKKLKKLEDMLAPPPIVVPEFCPVPLPGHMPLPVPTPPVEFFPHGHEMMLAPTMAYGFFGECFPALTPIFPPSPMPVPMPLLKPAPKMPPADNSTPSGGGSATPSLSPPGEIDRAVSLPREKQVAFREAVRVAPPRKPIRRLNVDGLGAADADRLFWRGYRLFWMNRHEEALVLFNAAVELLNEDARFWYFKSLAESAVGETAKANDSLHQAVELHVEGKPGAELIGEALERVQGEARKKLRETLDSYKVSR